MIRFNYSIHCTSLRQAGLTVNTFPLKCLSLTPTWSSFHKYVVSLAQGQQTGWILRLLYITYISALGVQ